MDIETLALSKKYTSSSVTSALTGIASAVVDQDGTKIVVTTNDGQIFELNITNQLTSSETQLIQSLSIVNDKLCLDGEEVGNALTKDQLGILNSVANKVDQTYLNENFYNRINSDGKYATKLNLNSHTNDITNPHKVELSQLADVVIDSPIDGQPLVYDSATGKIINKSASTLSDGKVKIDSSSTANYLSQLIDSQTIQVEDGKLLAKTLDGLNVTLTELNYLKGMDTNVKALISSIGTAGMYFGGVKQSKEDLSSLTGMSNGLTVIVQADESVSGSPTNTYIYDESNAQWLLVGATNIQIRDFTTYPIDLTKEVTGKLPKTNVDLTDLPTSSDLDNYLDKTTYDSNGNGIVDKAETLNNMTSTTQQIDASVKNSHSHTNNQAIEEATAGAGDGTKVWCDDNTFKTMQSGGSSSGSSVSKSDINGNIINNGEQIVVYDDTKVQSEINNLNDRSVIGKAPSYLSGYLGSKQTTGLVVGGRIKFDSVYSSTGNKITLNDGIIHLKRGTYTIEASCRTVGGNSSTYTGYQVYNITKGVFEGAFAQAIPTIFSGVTLSYNSQINTKVVVDEESDYEIRIIHIAGGAITRIDDESSNLSITELPSVYLLDPVEYAQDHDVKYGTFSTTQTGALTVNSPILLNTRINGTMELDTTKHGIKLIGGNNYYIELVASPVLALIKNAKFFIYNCTDNTRTEEILCQVSSATATTHWVSTGSGIYFKPEKDMTITVYCDTNISNIKYDSNSVFNVLVQEIKDPVVVNYTTAQDISNPLMSSQISQEAPIGTVIEYVGNSKPDHYLACNGKIYNIVDYPELFNKIGNKFGGDGTTTFAVPNYSGTAMDVTPIMTSNTTPIPYVASASSVYNNEARYYAYRAFNGTSADVNDAWLSAGISTSQYIMLDFGTPTTVDTVKILINNPNASTVAPKDFTVQGSNNGTDFAIIKTFSETSWTNNVAKTLSLDASVTYRYYKVNITSNNGYSGYVGISQLRFLSSENKYYIKCEATHYAINQYGGFQEDVLWEGKASSNGNYTLLYDPLDYDYIKIICSFSPSSSTSYYTSDYEISKEAIKNANGVYFSEFVEATGFRMIVTFNGKTITLNRLLYNWTDASIRKIIGVKGSIPTILEGGAL